MCAIFSNEGIAVAFLLVAVVFACPLLAQESDRSVVAPTQTRVVVVAPLSGEMEDMGLQMVEAARLAAQAAGIGIETIDETAPTDELLEDLEQLANRGEVAAIIGPMQRSKARVIAQMAQAVGIPILVYAPASDVEKSGGYVFRARLDVEEQAVQVVSHLAESMEARKIGVLAPQNSYGAEISKSLIEAANHRQLAVVALADYPRDATDFTVHLEVLVGGRADLRSTSESKRLDVDRHGTIELDRSGRVDFDTLIIADHHERVARLLPFLARVGISTTADDEGPPVQLVGLSGWRGDGLSRVANQAKSAIFFDTFGGQFGGSPARDLHESFFEQTGRTPTTPEAEIYDLVKLVGHAADSDDNPRQSVVRKLTSQSGFEGGTGTWRFSEQGTPRRQLRPFVVTDGGQWVVDDAGRQR